MHVQVHDRLPSRRTVVDAYVVTVRPMLVLQPLLRQLEQIENGASLFPRQLEKRPNVSSRNDQRVPRRQRETILDRYRSRVRQDDALIRESAEDATAFPRLAQSSPPVTSYRRLRSTLQRAQPRRFRLIAQVPLV
jgi:hypothetical protein